MIHPSVLTLSAICQVVQDIIMYPVVFCRTAKQALRKSVSMSGYSGIDMKEI